MNIYVVNTNYINYLRDNVDKRVMENEEEGRTRKYVGILFTINNFEYFVPLSSPKENDYQIIDNIKTIRKSVVPLHRIVVKDGEIIDFFGKLKFSSMIPIPSSEYCLLDIEKIRDKKYKSIIENQMRYIRKNQDLLLKKHAEVIYNQKTKGFQIGYLDHTVDFLKLEKACSEYNQEQI